MKKKASDNNKHGLPSEGHPMAAWPSIAWSTTDHASNPMDNPTKGKKNKK